MLRSRRPRRCQHRGDDSGKLRAAFGGGDALAARRDPSPGEISRTGGESVTNCSTRDSVTLLAARSGPCEPSRDYGGDFSGCHRVSPPTPEPRRNGALALISCDAAVCRRRIGMLEQNCEPSSPGFRRFVRGPPFCGISRPDRQTFISPEDSLGEITQTVLADAERPASGRTF
jgi:hypothetical protein